MLLNIYSLVFLFPLVVNKHMIRKTVGHLKETMPLKRAFKLYKMLIDLRGTRPLPNENVRKLVGRIKP